MMPLHLDAEAERYLSEILVYEPGLSQEELVKLLLQERWQSLVMQKDQDDGFEQLADQLAEEFSRMVGPCSPCVLDEALSRSSIYEDHP